ncbi:SanA/YdcF family protein [Nostocoides australiense]|nr:ElyC/SanA/YdcF family protein [Tetrasphaera australiensis]HRW00479.1 ElyC/SanA/YdcF family protein [Tetrasphaera sp.]
MRWRRTALALFIGAAASGLGILAGSNIWVARASAGRMYAVADVPAKPVALVLGAGLTPAGEPTPYLAFRLDLAKQLYDARKVEVLLVSGDNRTHAYDEPTAMMDYLVAQGVPATRIVRDFAGRDTYDSCARATRIFGVTEAIVVTQEYHLPRAVATCRAVGVDAVGVGDTRGQQYGATWSQGRLRERAAVVKASWDISIRRDPVLGAQESGVRDALSTLR